MSARVWQVAAVCGMLAQPAAQLPLQLKGSAGPIFSLAWSPDGRTLASAGFEQVNLWHVGSSTPMRTFRAHAGLVRSVAWSPDGASIASAGDDGIAHVWNAVSMRGALTIETGPVTAIAWSRDGRRLATGGTSAMLQVWNATTGALVHRARLQTSISSVAWSPDDKTVVAGGINGATTLWDADTGRIAAKIFISWPSRNDVNGLTWSPLGRLVAVAHGAGGVGGVTLWNPASGTVAPMLSNGGWQRGIAWSPDGQWLAAGGGEGSVRLLNVETSEVAATLATDSKPVWSVAWSPDGTRLAAGNSGTAGPPATGGTITIWNAPVAVLPRDRAGSRARALEMLLVDRRVLSPAATRPQPPATMIKDGVAHGAIVRLEPPFGNLETSFSESDLRALQIALGSTLDVRCREKTMTLLLGQHWGEVPRGEWVAFLSMDGALIVARNSGSAAEASACVPGDPVILSRRP